MKYILCCVQSIPWGCVLMNDNEKQVKKRKMKIRRNEKEEDCGADGCHLSGTHCGPSMDGCCVSIVSPDPHSWPIG